MQRARITLSKEALTLNYNNYLTQTNKQVIGVVKDNAYGHGSVLISKTLESLGCSLVAVTTLDEAIELRNHGISIDILLLGAVDPIDLFLCAKHHLSISIVSFDHYKKLCGVSFRGLVKVHIKIDTGMHRWGILPSEITQLLTLIPTNPHFLIEGIYTHYIGGENDLEVIHKQWKVFQAVIHSIPFHPRWIHSSSTSSSAIINEQETNAVRLGLGLYGLVDYQKPVLSLDAPIMRIEAIEAGEGISYHYRHHTIEKGYLYTLPIGYGDGWPLSYQTIVTPHKKIVPIVGTITMDACMVFSNDLFSFEDRFELIGETQTINNLTHQYNESPYVIPTRLSNRLERRII